MIIRLLIITYCTAICLGGPLQDYVNAHNEAKTYLRCIKWKDYYTGEKGRKEKLKQYGVCTEYEEYKIEQ